MKCVIANDLIDYCKHWIDVYDDSEDPKDKARRDELAAVIGEIINISTDYDEYDVYNDLIPRQALWYKPTGMMPPEFTGRHRCSACDGFAMHDWKRHKEQLTPFCPHCGAKMTNGGEEL